MAVTVTFGPTRAYITNGTWYSGDASLAANLQAVTDPEQVPASEPDQDEYLARDLAQVFGGQVVATNPPDPEADTEPGTVF